MSETVLEVAGWQMEALRGDYDIQPLNIGDGVVLDIGANEGFFCIWARMRFPAAEIHCYEPAKAQFEILKNRCDQFGGVHCHNVAVTNSAHPFLHYGVNCSGEQSIHNIGHQQQEGEFVESIPPSSLPKADFVKIDTEGCEIEILTGILSKSCPKGIALEWHSTEDRKRLAQILDEVGYTVEEYPNIMMLLAKGVNVGIMKAYFA